MTAEQSKPKSGESKYNKSRYRNGQLKRKVSAEVVAKHLAGIADADIARQVGIRKSAVHATLKEFAPVLGEIENLPKLREVKADLLDAAGLVLLKAMMNQEKLDKAPINQIGFCFKEINNAARLERGQATNITNTFTAKFSLEKPLLAEYTVQVQDVTVTPPLTAQEETAQKVPALPEPTPGGEVPGGVPAPAVGLRLQD
jgi:hypothetical protein